MRYKRKRCQWAARPCYKAQRYFVETCLNPIPRAFGFFCEAHKDELMLLMIGHVAATGLKYPERRQTTAIVWCKKMRTDSWNDKID